jgi:hypothetical protein
VFHGLTDVSRAEPSFADPPDSPGVARG